MWKKVCPTSQCIPFLSRVHYYLNDPPKWVGVAGKAVKLCSTTTAFHRRRKTPQACQRTQQHHTTSHSRLASSLVPQSDEPLSPRSPIPCPIQANEATLKNLSDDREAMKQSIRGLRARIEQLAGEREHAEKDSLEHTRLWQERAEALKAQGLQVTFSILLFRPSYLYTGGRAP